MNSLQAQKENIDSAADSDTSKAHFARRDKLSTPQRGFVIHEDSKRTCTKGSRERTSKNRRVLGDISNAQRDRQNSNSSGGIASAKKFSLNKGHARFKAQKSQKSTDKGVQSLKHEPPRVVEVPNIESAYGGLSSPTSDTAYLKGLHDEIIQDIINDKTPTLYDEFISARAVNDKSDENAILASVESPTSWLPDTTDLQEKLEEQDDDVPPPDISEETLDYSDADELLKDILSVDIETVCRK
ncbi:hypothetical protein PsorP6_013705 [Peronosclerospora sorghi]|uniref:Uncharacterized protein n=1 Tax=Peronosclerospora sorghi TaxID=230839 RepID=A0ACC0VGW6_9STRA|nr:hypothetical protein PsorP6_013705 [Peronosclerospora sorghi]